MRRRALKVQRRSQRRASFRAISTDILEFRARIPVIQVARGGYGSGADLGHGSARLFGRPRDALVPGSRLQTHGPAGSGGRLSVIMQPHRLMGTSRRPPIGWSQRGPGVRRPHVMSTLLEPRPLCQSTSRQASVRETPNVEARGCVRGRRTRPIDGPW